MSILVFVDHFAGSGKPVSWEIMGKARELGDALSLPVTGLVVGEQVGEIAQQAIGFGADQVLVADSPDFAQFQALAFTAALKAAIITAQPKIILAPATAGIRDAVALAACDLNIGVAAECQALSLDESGDLLADRPVFGGNIVTTIRFAEQPQAATVRGRSFSLPELDSARSGEITPLEVALDASVAGEEVLDFEHLETGDVSVENANIIIAGGRGVGGAEGFEPLGELAKLLGGAVGASRAAVDAGWISYPHQVGQTGKTVRPDLYIACGISGAIQHLAGMTNAKVIVAINKDGDAPVFSVAQYGIVGDLFRVVPALTDAFRTRMGD